VPAVRTEVQETRSGSQNWSAVAPSFVGVCDAGLGSGRRSLEVFMSFCRCGGSNVVDRGMVVDLALHSVRQEAENADVQVGHDRAPGSGSVIETAFA
jgi:hypothetical protein